MGYGAHSAPGPADPLAESAADLRSRVEAVPGALLQLSAGLGGVVAPRDPELSFVATGIGGSRAPARVLVASLVAAGRRARFAPLSGLALGERLGQKDVVCIFSQGLCPNARMALAAASRAGQAFLFTSLTEADPRSGEALERFVGEGGEIVHVPPPSESRTLLRIVGPAAAILAATMFASEVTGLPLPLPELGGALEASSLAAAVASEGLSSSALTGSLAFVTAGAAGAFAEGLSIKWLEGLCTPEPPVWDVLEVAHGSFHAFYERPILLVALEHQLTGDERLFDRLASLLVPERHVLLRLRARLPLPLARLEHEVAVNALLLRAFEASPRDLFHWPSQDKDMPLYGMDAPDQP